MSGVMPWLLVRLIGSVNDVPVPLNDGGAAPSVDGAPVPPPGDRTPSADNFSPEPVTVFSRSHRVKSEYAR